MYGSFEGWYHSNKRPWETRSDAKARYESVYGKDDEELEVVDTPSFSYEPEEAVDEEDDEEGFFGKGQDISSIGTGLGRGFDQLQAIGGSFLSDKIAGSLPESLKEYEQPLTDLGDEIYYRNIKEAEEDWGPKKPSRLEQRKLDDPNYQRALTKEEFIEQNPDHWKSKLYKKFPKWLPSWERFKETAPTAEELGEMVPTSITPSIVGRTGGGIVGSVGGPAGTFGGQMAGGATTSSAMSATQISREIRDNPTVRTTIGLDPNVSYQDDSYENKNKMQRLAKMIWGNSFANRLTSSGLPEMAGYAAFGKGLGGVFSRAVTDVAGGTWSELWDIDMSRRSIVESLKKFSEIEGEPLSEQQLAQINKTLFELGPKKREIFSQAFVGELLLGTPGAFIELGLEKRRDHRVDEPETDTAQMRKTQKELDESDNKRLEIVGSPYMEIQTLYDEGKDEQAYELYKEINKENRKQNALSDLLQKNRYEDIYKDFLDRDRRAEEDQQIAEEIETAEGEVLNEGTEEINDAIKEEVKLKKEFDTELEKEANKFAEELSKTAEAKAKEDTDRQETKRTKETTTTKKTKTKTKTKTKAAEKEMITVYLPDGTPVEVEVVARSKAGSVKIIDPDTGKQVLLGNKYDTTDPKDGEYILNTADWGKGLQTVSSLSDKQIEQGIQQQDRRIKAGKEAKQTQNIPSYIRNRNALVLEQKRRAKAKDKKTTAKEATTTKEKVKTEPDVKKKVKAKQDTKTKINNYIDKGMADFLKKNPPPKKGSSRLKIDEYNNKRADKNRELAVEGINKYQKKFNPELREKENEYVKNEVEKAIKLRKETGEAGTTAKEARMIARTTRLQDIDVGMGELVPELITKWTPELSPDEINILEGKARARFRRENNIGGILSLRATTPDEVSGPGISKEGVQNAIETFKKNSNQKIKDMNITVLSKDDEADVQILRGIVNKEYEGISEQEVRENLVNERVEEIFNKTEGFVEDETNDVYIISNQIFGYETGKPTDRLAQVLYHETIGHVGLRQTLGKEYKTFINRFLKTNKKLLKEWATEGTGQVYLPLELRGKEKKVRLKGYDKMSNDAKLKIADEYIAQHFAEHGARDPNIIDRIAVHFARALNKLGLWGKMTTNEAKLTLREVQQDYIGGNRNFITGENFRKVPLIHYDDDILEEKVTGDEEGLTLTEAGLLSDSELEAHLTQQGTSRSVRTPKKIIKKVYKLMEIKDGEMYYPIVEKKTDRGGKGKPRKSVELGEWVNAEFIPRGDMASKGKGMRLAPRGGFHLTENLSPHLITELKDGTKRVWVEAEIGNDVDYQGRVGEFGKNTEFLLKRDKDGNVIDGKVPEGGQYRFRRPVVQGGWWRIAGEMRLLRILPEAEVNTLLNEYVTSKEYTDALAEKAKKKQKKETAESKILKGISQSKAMGIYARYNKDAGVKGTMLLHRNTRPNEGDYRITFFKEDGELDMARTENKMGHEHFPTLAKAKSRLNEVGEDIQDISGGRSISRSVRKVGTFREELAKAEARRKGMPLESIDKVKVKPVTDKVTISPEGKRLWEQSAISFSQRLRRDEMPQGVLIRDKVLLDMKKIKGLSDDEIKKLSSGNGPFIFMWDRMRGDGFYETPSGVRIPLQGGMANSYLTYNMEAGIIGSSTSAGSIKDVITARVKESNGYGIVALMTPEAHGSNPTFFTIYTQVIRDVLGTKGAERTALENKFAELIKSGSASFRKPFENANTTKGSRGDQRSNKVLQKINNAKTPKQKYKIFEEEGKKLTFDVRKSIFTGLGGQNISAELGIPSFQKMLIDTIDPEFGPKPDQSWANFKGKTGDNNTGNIVQVMKFNKDKPLSTAEAEGLAKKHAHLSYDISFMGKVIGRFKGKGIPLLDATNPFYKGVPKLNIEPYRSKEGKTIRTEKRQGTTMMKMPVAWKGVPESQREAFFKKYSGDVKVRDVEGKDLTYTKVMKGQFSPETMLKPTKRNRTKSALKASKELISQSVNFSRSRAEQYLEKTRIASQGRGPLSGLARKMTRRLISQGTLEDYGLYKQLRRRTKGTLLRMEQTAEKFYKVIKNSKQQKEIYDYLTTPDADKTKIVNEYERKIVVQVKKEIRENGRRLVEDHHLMTRKTLDRLDDQYLPRKYLRYLLRDSDYAILSKGGGENIANLDLSYLKKRQDIEKGVRELILGEIKDPAFLSATAFATPRKDMALLDFMEQIASDVGVKRGWVLPKTLVTFDTIGLMKQLAGESPETSKLIKELELMETKGVRVSGHWLVNEAERIQNLATKHMELTPEKTILVKKLTDRMSDAGKKIVGDVVPKDYVRVPKGRKYGKLQGMAIRKEIFEDLFGWSTGKHSFNINDDGTIDRNMAEKILGTGGTFEQFNRFWKWSKVSANPPSWVRNFISNLIFMNMGPVPLHRMPDLFIRSIKDQISTRIKLAKGDKNNEIFDEKGNPLTDTARADIMGLTSGGFSQVELKMIKSNFEEAVRRGDPQEGIAGLMTIRNAFRGIGKEEKLTGKAKALAKAGLRDPFVKYVQKPTSDLYGGIDTLGKVMMMKYLHGDHVRNPKTGKSFNERFGWMPFEESKKPKWEGANRLYSMDEAAAEAEKWLFDYSNPLPSVKYLRKSAFGAPFLSYPSFVAPLIIETILTRPWKFIPHILFGEAMVLGFKSVYDIDDEEYDAVVEETNDYIKKKAKGGNLDKVPDFVPFIGGKPFIPRSIIPVFNPFSKEKNLDENGRAQLLDIGYLQPYGMFTDIFRQLDPTKETGIEPAQALHTFGMLSSPLINIATTILTNRDPFTDRQIYDEFATGGEKLGAWGHYLWNLSMPPMVHGLTQIGEGKGFGAITRLIEQHTHFVTKEGEAKHTKAQAYWRAVGINITPIAPHEARAKNALREVAKINRLKQIIKKNAEDALFNNVPLKDIDEMIRKDVKKMEDLADALEKRLSTPLPASLKRTEKQRLEILNKFLERRKAS